MHLANRSIRILSAIHQTSKSIGISRNRSLDGEVTVALVMYGIRIKTKGESDRIRVARTASGVNIG
jgi:hypothetical protein